MSEYYNKKIKVYDYLNQIFNQEFHEDYDDIHYDTDENYVHYDTDEGYTEPFLALAFSLKNSYSNNNNYTTTAEPEQDVTAYFEQGNTKIIG
ncbi:hypothetical protein DICPUDRAFT_158179 [Dictyostelium purpureum]|uniref:Uncharacterized protein n=1 Tax=Dictyostelium purpureum TaxID=5786 RepID=F1A110_DICPU|nr:uncharacterized protein DICPUDRAFT_158179 [Dictyostelium purpureum]EGC30119.1 hypothetical protein DICPUDRAFT_158179 [Dictyostelium purpureum]|eukprot:XP_003293351.1 hypothetical protein DICPUDRAFT_158179 [Dictyostelium purpureum]